jgi:hypothetical protein
VINKIKNWLFLENGRINALNVDLVNFSFSVINDTLTIPEFQQMYVNDKVEINADLELIGDLAI